MNDISSEPVASGDGTNSAVVPTTRAGSLRQMGGGGAIALGYDGVGMDEGSGYLQLWRTILKWRWVVIGTFVAVVGLSILITLLTTPIYRATAVLEIAAEEITLIDTEESKTQSVSRTAYDYLQTQYGLLASRSLAERVARNMNLAAQEGFGYPEGESAPSNTATALTRATAVLTGGLQVKPVAGSRLVNVEFDSPNPEMATRVVNGYGEAFIESSLERRMGSTTQTRAILERRLAEAKTRLELSERAATAYARQAGIVNIEASNANSESGTTSLEAASLAQ